MPLTATPQQTGTASNSEGYDFLGKFAFDANPVPVSEGHHTVGWIDIELTALTADKYSPGNLTVFVTAPSDHENDYPEFYHTQPCEMKPLLDGVTARFDTNGTMSNGPHITLPIPGGTRRRFHYLVIINCRGYGAIEYKAHFYRDADSWSRELGVNNDGLNTFYIVFLLLSVGLLAATIYNTVKSTRALTFLHPLMRLNLYVVALQFIANLLHTAHFTSLAYDGYGAPLIELLGDILDVATRVVFIMVLILIASGWTISRASLPNRGLVIGFSVLFAVLQIVSLFVLYLGVDPAAPELPTDVKVFNYVVIGLGFVFALWFIITAVHTIRTERNKDKQGILIVFSLFISVYIISLPFVSFLSIALDAWVRERVVAMYSTSVTFAAVVYLGALLWHTRYVSATIVPRVTTLS